MSGSSALGFVESVSSRTTSSAVTDNRPDGVLLERFFKERDEEAFETLILRHGPMVRRICRGWLGDGQDADDAVQATFIALINRAGEIRRSETIGAWLGVVARRVAGRMRLRNNQRRFKERADLDVREIAGRVAPDSGDLSPTLRAEVDRLPEKYRRPIKLCYWEGLSNEEAAERLRCPTGTLKWRLFQARGTASRPSRPNWRRVGGIADVATVLARGRRRPIALRRRPRRLERRRKINPEPTCRRNSFARRSPWPSCSATTR